MYLKIIIIISSLETFKTKISKYFTEQFLFILVFPYFIYFSYLFIYLCNILPPSSKNTFIVLNQLFVKILMLLLCLMTLHTKLNVNVDEH